jgi:S1-C subfamily serine protease
VELGAFEAPQPRVAPAEPTQQGNVLGFTVSPLPANVARRFGLQGDQVPVVTDIDQLSPAGGAGLFMYDVIRKFNGQEIRSIADLERAARAVGSGKVVSLIVVNARQADATPRIVNYRTP